jgi:pSer/pThr/pTyr-binding forkhead associated (FHA) protein
LALHRCQHVTISRAVAQTTDLGSTNGTSVDGAVVIAGVLRPLQPGARLKIGDIELSVGYG